MSKNLLALLRDQVPLIDVRAPAEFARGAFPDAVNLPILNDTERQAVGRTYRESGQAAAVALGHELVRGPVKAQRVQAWCDYLARHPDARLYCWRGGLRSEIACTWLAEAGRPVDRIPEGFKALRQAALAYLAEPPAALNWWVLSGRTGSGKTRLLERLPGTIDLEGLANHRGSAFGGRSTPQPVPVDFEHQLAAAMLRHPGRHLIIEDESRTIGRLGLPATWYEHMQRAPRLVLEVPLTERVANIRQEYVDLPLAAGTRPDQLQATYAAALSRIRRRLGGQRLAEITGLLAAGFRTGKHEPWIAWLLEQYYDPMYDYQLSRRQAQIRARGDADHIVKFVRALQD